jgi:hypothetical protein
MTRSPTVEQDSRARISAMRRYVLATVIGALATLGLMVGAMAALDAKGALPPPQFSNSLCMDEKLNAMREDPPSDVDLLVVGSSVAWRHFNSPAAIAQRPSLKPYNAGFCGARIDQTEQVVTWLTTRLPDARHVLLIASPIDFEGCSESGASEFNVKDADSFVFGGAWPPYYYARYFDPVTLARNAPKVRWLRRDQTAFNSLVQNRFGDGPIDPPRSRGLFYKLPSTPDASCFASLTRIARRLRQDGKTLDVVMTPLHPDWVGHDPARAHTIAALEARARAALEGVGGHVLAVPHHPDRSAFFDAIHLRSTHTGDLTRKLISEVYRRPDGGDHRANGASGSSRGQPASLSEMTLTGSGHSMPSKGSL